MIGAVLKLIIFTSMVNRIISNSRNERVTQQFYDTYLQIFDVCTLRHTAHIEVVVQFLPYSAQQVRWPARSPDLTPCDYFLWGYVKDKVFVPPQPVSIPDLKNRITAAVETITPDLLSRVWQELDYLLDVCRVTKGAYIENLYVCVINLLSYSFISTSIYNSVHHTCEYNQLQNRSNHFDIPCIL